jgi:hypothetical protein
VQSKRQAALIKGEPIAAHLVSRIIDANGKRLAEWYLLSNTPVTSQILATWYYWRWQIECFFKPLKQHGLQLEDWQQETGLAIAKRLLIWQLQYDITPQANEIKHFLVRLSGRQMKKIAPSRRPLYSIMPYKVFYTALYFV